MKRTRHQQGYVFKKGNVWFLRYYDRVIDAQGQPDSRQKCRKLAEAVGHNRTKQAARELAAEFLAPLNNGTTTPESSMTLETFVDQFYLPHVEEHKRKSTHDGYSKMWKRYIKPRAQVSLRDFRTVEGELLLAEIARCFNLSRRTLAHLKAFLSGAFRFARRQGVLRTENPMRDVVLPKARQAEETYAYSLEEIMQMLVILSEPAATIVATAAFTGARRGEIRGMLWDNYHDGQIRITQSVWRSHIDVPKTRESVAPVPVIPALAKFLENHRQRCGDPKSGLMFVNSFGRPLDLDLLAREVVKPAVENAGLQWHGWHAFRRGLATNLHRLGVQDKVIQAILRHSTVTVTQNAYIKTVSADATAAMKTLEAICVANYATNMQPGTKNDSTRRTQ